MPPKPQVTYEKIPSKPLELPEPPKPASPPKLPPQPLQPAKPIKINEVNKELNVVKTDLDSLPKMVGGTGAKVETLIIEKQNLKFLEIENKMYNPFAGVDYKNLGFRDLRTIYPKFNARVDYNKIFGGSIILQPQLKVGEMRIENKLPVLKYNENLS